MRGNALSNSSKENQNPLILSGTKPQSFNQSLRTNNAEYLSRNPLKIINGNSASRSPLTPLSKNIEFSQNLQSTGNSFSESPLTPLSTDLEFTFSGIENRYLKHTELQDINVELCKQQISEDFPLCLEDLGKQSLRTLDTTKAVPVVGNYQSSDKDRLTTGQMLMSTLHEVQVDSNFQPSFEKLGTDGYCLNTKPNAKPNLKQPGKRKNRLCGKSLRDRELLDNSPYTPPGNTSRSYCSQISGVQINGETCATPDTPYVHKLRPTGFEGEQRNMAAPKTNQSAKSTVTFVLPASTIFKRSQVTLDSSSDNAVKQQSKKTRGKISPSSSAYDTSSVKCYYEQGESSGSKNLLGEFNNVEDCDSSDSDCISSGKNLNSVIVSCDDVDVHEFDNIVTKWSEYLDVGDPDRICSKCQTIMWNHERNNKSATKKPPTFSHCCKNGQIILEKEKQPPEPLASLLTGGSHFRHFKENIRMYNCMFAMSSTGGQINRSINHGGAPYCFKVKCVNYHSIGSFVPLDGEIPKFCQLYIYDTEDEVHNRINAVKGGCDAVDEDIVQSLLEMLDKHNRLVKGFRMAREIISQNAVDEFRLVLISSSSASGRPNHIGPSHEVVGLIVTDEYAKRCRDTIIHSRTNGLERIFETDPRFMQLQYPILFPHRDIGYYRQIPLNRPNQKNQKQRQNTENKDPDEKGEREFITMKEYYNYKLMMRPSKGLTPHLGGRLWQQYVDAFTAIEQYRRDWIRGHQTTIRSDMYHNIRDAPNKGDNNPENIGKATILPASFTGSKRYINQYFKDAMPEIQRMLKFLPGVDVVDAPDVVARVFKMKVDQLLDQIKNRNCFGRCIGVGYEAVKNYMIHSPCGTDCVKSPCMVKGHCIKHFPKRYNSHTYFDECGFPIYKRGTTGITVKKKGIDLDNRYVVPYNRDLLIRFQCHTNLEICNSFRSLKYLFKYCLKGHDTATMYLRKKINNKKGCTTTITPEKQPLDEVKQYLDGRYVCASEASWRIFGFDIHSRWPSVERLPIHLPNDKHVSFKGSQNLQEVFDNAGTKKSKLEAWFNANKTYAEAPNLTYSEFPSKFTWHPQPGIRKQRKIGDVIGRLADVHSSSGELLYLRMLLLRIKGDVCFDDLKKVNDHVYNSFHEACVVLGILQNDQQWREAIGENAHTSMPPQLCAMFVNILVYSPISNPRSLWEAHWGCTSDDILLVRRYLTGNPNLCLLDIEIQNYVLAEREKLLNDIGKSLRNFPDMPYPGDAFFSNSENILILEKTSYDTEEMKRIHTRNHSLLNDEHKIVYDSILDNINQKKGGIFFVYGSGGCGKTFLCQTLCCRLRSEHKIVLPVASCGIAAVLLPGGRTAHSRFHIPLKLDENCSAGLRYGTDISELLQRTDLIIWDEAPM
ncbi:uncharacterized protein LOC141711871 [Apium graveolens]|uniref:uncharacterized protein LOC141711871 n=1 Tax=Apium graveolens TaxID=4045 RepID=UPI003D797628